MSRLLPVALPLLGFAGLIAAGALLPRLADVLDLALPFFGLIASGYVCGELTGLPESGLIWLNFFIVYVALPALFFNLIAATPIHELANWHFVLGTTAATFTAFVMAFGIGLLARGGDIAAASIQGVAGAYANVGYMGPGLTLAALGTQSVVPTALIFVSDSILLFSLVPCLMELSGTSRLRPGATAVLVLRRILTHPFNIAIAAGVAAAYVHLHVPVAIGKTLALLQNAAAPCALFGMGVTVALRPLHRLAPETPFLLVIKLLLHPLLVWLILSALGDFGRIWSFTAVLMAALPPALNVFVLASQYKTYMDEASSTILIGTIASVATVTGLLYLIGAGLLPYRLFAW